MHNRPFAWAVILGVVAGALLSVWVVRHQGVGHEVETRGLGSGVVFYGEGCAPHPVFPHPPPVPSVVPVAVHEVPAWGLRLDPPAADVKPRVAATDAWRTAVMGWSDNAGGSATLRLGILNSDEGLMSANADGSVTRSVQDRLTWLVTFRDVVVTPLGPPTAHRRPRLASGPSCHGRRLVAVDATNGEIEFVQEVGGSA